jgi:hypothetical protein
MEVDYGEFSAAVQEFIKAMFIKAKIPAHLASSNLPKRADASKLADNDDHRKLR